MQRQITRCMDCTKQTNWQLSSFLSLCARLKSVSGRGGGGLPAYEVVDGCSWSASPGWNDIVLILSEHRIDSLSISVGSSIDVSFVVRITHMWQRFTRITRRFERFNGEPWQQNGNRPVESHSGAQGNIIAGPPNMFAGPLRGENFGICLFKMVHSGVFLYFWATAGLQTSRGPE